MSYVPIYLDFPELRNNRITYDVRSGVKDSEKDLQETMRGFFGIDTISALSERKRELKFGVDPRGAKPVLQLRRKGYEQDNFTFTYYPTTVKDRVVTKYGTDKDAGDGGVAGFTRVGARELSFELLLNDYGKAGGQGGTHTAQGGAFWLRRHQDRIPTVEVGDPTSNDPPVLELLPWPTYKHGSGSSLTGLHGFVFTCVIISVDIRTQIVKKAGEPDVLATQRSADKPFAGDILRGTATIILRELIPSTEAASTGS